MGYSAFRVIEEIQLRGISSGAPNLAVGGSVSENSGELHPSVERERMSCEHKTMSLSSDHGSRARHRYLSSSKRDMQRGSLVVRNNWQRSGLPILDIRISVIC